MSTPDTPGPDAEGGFRSVDDELADVPEKSSTAVKADPDSPLVSLRERRARAAAMHFDLEVPHVDVWVRYKPVRQRRAEEIFAQVERRRGEKNKTVVANATILADACLGVFEVIDGENVSVDPDDRGGEWPKFDQRLAEILGVRAGKSSEVVQALYVNDGDIISTASKVSKLSGYADDPAERDDPGN